MDEQTILQIRGLRLESVTGNVIVEQPRGELRGEKVTYEIATGKLTGSGEGTASRVQMRLNPSPQAAKETKTP